MRIIVTNDDGIDSVGLHVLARALVPLGDVVVVAPDGEYSGASAAFGALHLIQPEVHRVQLDGVPEVWTVNGPPALSAMFATRFGLFGGAFDLMVSGINPGANVGRAVYHSGTIGACVTARNAGVNGIAVSQSVTGFGVEGQGWDEMVAGQLWDTAASAAVTVARALLSDLPADPVVVNLNVPNVPVDQLAGWRRATIATMPPRSMASAELVPKIGHDNAFRVTMQWGEPVELPPETDGGAVERNEVSISYLSRVSAVDHPVGATLERALGQWI